MSNQVRLTKFVQKQFIKLPQHIQISLRVWVDFIEKKGLSKMRCVPGYHDEPVTTPTAKP